MSLFAERASIRYPAAMNTTLMFAATGIVSLFLIATSLRADQVDMQNGDRYIGKVLSVTAETVVLESDVLGRINVPRKNVASLAFGNSTVASKPVTKVAPGSIRTNLPAAAPSAALSNTNTDLSAAIRQLGANTNFIGQILEQMLVATPEAAVKYDELVSGLMSGRVNISELRREAQSSADQLRALKDELGPDVGESLDVYLNVLDSFLKESAAQPVKPAPVPSPKAQVR